MIWTDSSSNQCAGGVGVVLQSPEGDLVECTICLQFPTTNNEAEYEVVLLSLDLTKAAKTSLVVVHNDSQVIVGHINGDYKAKGEQMKEYLSIVKGRVSQKLLAKFMQIPREENDQAVRLPKTASAEHMVIASQVLSFAQYSPAIDKIDLEVISMGANWTTSIVLYLKDGMLLEDHNASCKLKV